MNNRGSIQDLLLIGAVLLVASFFILFGYKIASEFNAHVQTDSHFDARARSATSTLTAYYPGVVNNSFLYLTIGMCLVTLVLAALVRIHPIFIPFFFIGLVLVIFFSGVLSNIYQTLAANTAIAAQAVELTKISMVMNRLPYYIGVFGIILMIVMYKTWSVNQ